MIGTILSSLLVLRLLKKRKPKTKKGMFTEDNAKEAVLAVAAKYGSDMAKLIEKMMRLETAHFKSSQYKATGSAGMEKGKWKGIPADIETIPFVDNKTKKVRPFIKWNSVTDFAFYLADYINRYNGKFERWNSLDTATAANYKKEVNSIKNRFI